MEKQDLDAALAVLRRGGVIAGPTDTVWGLACDAGNPDAVDRLFRIKHRDPEKAMLVLVDSLEMARRCVGSLPQAAMRLWQPGRRPATLILTPDESAPQSLAPALISREGMIGIRLCRDAVAAGICRELGRPLVSTSANFSGRPAPRIFSEIDDEVLQAVDYVMLQGRNGALAQPSKIIKLLPDGVLEVIRS